MTDDGYLVCHESKCDQKIRNHRWAKIKADGWFFAKDGKVFCPQHIPEWVSEWRKGR